MYSFRTDGKTDDSHTKVKAAAKNELFGRDAKEEEFSRFSDLESDQCCC